jgi:pyruvate-formate lyase-activating enzyme
MNIHRITYNAKTQSCSLYFIGCNFACRACYWKQIYGRVDFRRLQFPNLEETIDILRPVSPEKVYMISGEPRPCQEYDRLPLALHAAFGCEVRLLTNGYLLPGLDGLHHASVSIKAFDDALHREYTGKSNRQTLANFRLLHEKNVELSCSSVLIPGLIGSAEIAAIARYVASVDSNIPYRIIGYMPVDGLPYRRPTVAELQAAAAAAKASLNQVVFSDPAPQDYTGIVDLFTNHLRR